VDPSKHEFMQFMLSEAVYPEDQMLHVLTQIICEVRLDHLRLLDEKTIEKEK
jgi:hypothetical protein